MKENWTYRRGDIYLANLNPYIGSEQGGTRPILLLQNNTGKPKTETSTRKVFLPETVSKMLIERRKTIQEEKELFGDEYYDYNLVFCSPIGRPMENQVITRMLKELIKKHDLPPVVFHSLRHSSITYKLKLSGGDIKMVQGDSGHAQATMVTEQYAHILDDDRKQNAKRLEDAFYMAPQNILCKRFSTKSRISHDPCA